MTAPADTSGSKNAIQSRASTVTYLQRYCLIAAFGLVTANQDDDGRSSAAGSPSPPSPPPSGHAARRPARPPAPAAPAAPPATLDYIRKRFAAAFAAGKDKFQGVVTYIQPEAKWKQGKQGKSTVYEKTIRLDRIEGGAWPFEARTISNPADARHPWTVGDVVTFAVTRAQDDDEQPDSWEFAVGKGRNARTLVYVRIHEVRPVPKTPDEEAANEPTEEPARHTSDSAHGDLQHAGAEPGEAPPSQDVRSNVLDFQAALEQWKKGSFGQVHRVWQREWGGRSWEAVLDEDGPEALEGFLAALRAEEAAVAAF